MQKYRLSKNLHQQANNGSNKACKESYAYNLQEHKFICIISTKKIIVCLAYPVNQFAAKADRVTEVNGPPISNQNIANQATR